MKRDTGAEPLEAALEDCRREAWREARWSAPPLAPLLYRDALGRRYPAWPGSLLDPFGSQFLEETRLTHFCMRAKGWELVPEDAAKQ